MFFIGFDIDGTLVDTRAIVEKAYLEAGLHSYPSHAWGKPWEEWLIAETWGIRADAEAIHARKTEIYLQMLTDTPVAILPAGEVMQIMLTEGLCDVGFLTGASTDAAALILMQLGLNMELHPHVTNASRQMKAELLSSMRGTDNEVVYVDDDELAGRAICKAAQVSFVHAHGQDVLRMMEDIWTA